MLSFLRKIFEIESRGSSLGTEVLAGLSTFLALSYIFIVNPAILSQAGMNKSAVLFATIVTSALATIIMGLWARLPFALAPGMEMNAYVAFFVVGTLGFSWKQALGAVFWSGVLFLVLSILRIREQIIEAIPDKMKSSLALSVGVFLALIALKISGLLQYQGVRISGLGSFVSPAASAFYFSVALVVLLDRLRVRGAVIVSIAGTVAFCLVMGFSFGTEKPAAVSAAMFSGIGKFDPRALFGPGMLNVILVLFLIDFYGSVAKMIGLTSTTNIAVNGKVPHMREALTIDSGATISGAILGTTSLTVYVESGVGIAAGGRTGLTAVVAGTLMFGCLALVPLLAHVPLVATTGALVLVAIKLCPSPEQLRSFSRIDILATILMQACVVATSALDRAMLAGFLVYLVSDLLGRRRLNPYLVGSTGLLAIGMLAQ